MTINPISPATLALGVAITALCFTLFAFFTRATFRRAAAALIASIPVVPWIMLMDAIAARYGWWRYPSVSTASAPLAWYIAAALFYGAGLGLVGWRIIRRFATRGVISFVIGFALFGVARDTAYYLTTQFIEFGPGWVPFMADFFSYALAAAIVQIGMAWIAGPPSSDRLARNSKKPSYHLP